MLAARQSPYPMHGADTRIGYGVGAFVEQTFLQRGTATTHILWRWPDAIDRLPKPENDPPDDELVPWLFRQPEAEAEPAA